MLPSQFALSVAARLNACSTITEQSIMLSQLFADVRKEACIDTAIELSVELKESRFTDEMPMATWPFAQRFASNICKDYAQKLQCTTEKTPAKGADFDISDIGPEPVNRNVRGFWRHHRFPVFRPEESEVRQQWFRLSRLHSTGTYLVPPEGVTTSGNDDCQFWEVREPADGKWFLLAIEATSSGPVAVWAAKVGAA